MSEGEYGQASLGPDYQAGTVVGHYKIVKKIGSGGMGEVYLGLDTQLGRQVALKFFPNLESPDRFIEEARAVAALDHPNVVSIYEIGRHENIAYFAMQYIEGVSLSDSLTNKIFSIDDIVSLAIMLCDGISEIHNHGIVHCDLKLSNIILTVEGRPVILDFSIAATLTNKLSPEGTSGTLAYMSPERLRGEKFDHRADLFSFGVILYQLITGQLPFAGEYEAALKYSIINDTPRPISALRKNVPENMALIVARLLDKDASQRYQSAFELKDDLEQLGHKTKAAPLDIGSRKILVYVVVAAVVIFALVKGAEWFYGTSEQSGGDQRVMIAVLPFANLGAEPDDYMAEGITDEIIFRLATIKTLGVISRTSSGLYKESEKGITEIGRELGVDYIIEGTVRLEGRPDGRRILIIAKLVRVSDDTHLWENRYERTLTSLFDIQSSIAIDVSRALDITLLETEQASISDYPTDNIEAYDFYLRGIQYFSKSFEESDVRIATQMFRRAVDLDSNFASAWAMLSRGHESMYWEYYDHSQNRQKLARLAAYKSLTLQPNSADSRLAVGYYLYHCEIDYEGALKEFQSALAIRPSNADLYAAIGAVQRRFGQFDSSIANFKRSLELDPRSNLKALDIGLTLGMMRQWDKADGYLDIAISLAPDAPIPHIYKAWLAVFRNGDKDKAAQILEKARSQADITSSRFCWWLSRTIRTDYQEIINESRVGPDTAAYFLHLAQMNRLLDHKPTARVYADSARRIIEKKVARFPDDARFHSYLGLAYAGLGRKTDAIAHCRGGIELRPTSGDAFDGLFFALNLAEVLVMFDEPEEAIQVLEQLLSVSGFISAHYLKLDPLWIPLRENPRFKALVIAAQ